MDEREAIEQLRGGDIGGLEFLVRRYQREALRVAYLIGRDTVLAEDIVQEAFLRAYERIARFDPERPFGPWFLRCVANDTRNAIRRRHLPNLAAPLTLIERGDDPEALLLAAEGEEEVRRALDQLTPGQRMVIVARYYCDLPDAVAARRFNLPAGTIRRRLHDARLRLRRLLPVWGGD